MRTEPLPFIVGRAAALRRKGPEDYGGDVPSPLSRPRPGQAPGPRRGVPPGIFVPIPVNIRSVENELNRIIRAETPALTRWLVSTVNAQAEALKFEEMRNAVRDGEIPYRWEEQWQQSYAGFINDRLAPRWEQALGKGAARLVAGIDGLGVEHDFQLLGSRVTDWIDRRGADLVVDLTGQQTQALNALLRNQLVVDPLGPKEIGRLIRPLIGNTKQEAAWISKRFLSVLGESGSVEKATTAADRFSGFLRRRRGERIARTELAFAYNNGSRLAVKDALDGGSFPPGDTVRKVWYAQFDERTCPFCGELHEQTVGFEETFPAVTKALPNVFVPPAHPHCRCVILYELVEGEPPKVEPVVPVEEPAEVEPEPAAEPVEEEGKDLYGVSVPDGAASTDESPLSQVEFDRILQDQKTRNAARFDPTANDVDLIAQLDEYLDGLDHGVDWKPRNKVANWEGGSIKFVDSVTRARRGVVNRTRNRWFRAMHPNSLPRGEFEISLETKRGGRRKPLGDFWGDHRNQDFCWENGIKAPRRPNSRYPYAKSEIRIFSRYQALGFDRTVAHEMTHFLEGSNGRIKDAVYFLKRARGPFGFRVSAYANKVYSPGGQTEIATEGLGILFEGGRDAARLIREDPDWFAAMTAILEGRFGYRPGYSGAP